MASVSSSPVQARVRAKVRSRWPAVLALLPAGVIVVVCYLGTMLWTLRLSFTSSKMLPVFDGVGWQQYDRLFHTERFVASIGHVVLFGVPFIAGSLILGFLLAVLIDQRIRFESVFRTIFLYPYAMSFVVTGLVWQWVLNPALGLQKIVRDLGVPNFTFDWIVNQKMVVYTLVIAAVWQAAGLVMALILAGLRGIDTDLWNATRIDAVPTWRVYVSIVLPMIMPMVATATVLLATAVAKLYDLVVAMTHGGPGIASEVPATFIMDNLLERSNVGLGTAAATVLFVTVVAVLSPWIYVQALQARRRRR